MPEIQALPEWCRAWASLSLARHLERGGREPAPEEWTSLRDWLVAMATERPGLVRRLVRIPLGSALTASERWHEALATRAERRRGRRGDRVGDPDGVETCRDTVALPGWRWVRVVTREGLDYEGASMGHCAGSGAYDDFATQVLSLRDPSNVPHCTVDWDPRRRIVRQVRGRGNAAPAERYHAEVAHLVRGLDPVQILDAPLFGHFILDGCLTAIGDLQPGTHIRGRLDLRGCTVLRSLPPGLRIGCGLRLDRCTALEALPPDLEVGGELSARGCTALRSLPEDIRIARSIDLGDCTSLAVLPPRLVVTGGLCLDDCTALHELPEDLRVDWNLSAARCTALRTIPSGLHVRGLLDLEGCTGIVALPSGLQVGDLVVRGCTGLASLPPGLQVRRDLDASHCTALARIPADLDVACNINLFGCVALADLPDLLEIRGGLQLGGCTTLVRLPDRFRVPGRLSLEDCLALRRLPDGLDVGTLWAPDVPSLEMLPAGLRVRYDVAMVRCPALVGAGEDIVIGGDLDLRGCTGLLSLPADLRTGGDLDLRGCSLHPDRDAMPGIGGEIYPDGCTPGTWMEPPAREQESFAA